MADKILVKKGNKRLDIAVPRGFSISDILNSLKQLESKRKKKDLSGYGKLVDLTVSEDNKKLVLNFKSKKLYLDFPTMKIYKEDGKVFTYKVQDHENTRPDFLNVDIYNFILSKGEINYLPKWICCFFRSASCFGYKDFSLITSNKKLMHDLERLSKLEFFHNFVLDDICHEYMQNILVSSIKRKEYSNTHNFKQKYQWVFENYSKLAATGSHFLRSYLRFSIKERATFEYAFENYGYLIIDEDYDTYEYFEELVDQFDYDPKRLVDYICRDLPNQGFDIRESYDTLCTLRDYARMNVAMDIEDYEKYPRYLLTFHKILESNYEVHKSAQFKQAFKNAVNSFKSFEYKNEKYSVIVPNSFDHLVEEGSRLGHCVASYADKIAEKSTTIMFVRKNEQIDIPLVTIEIKKNKIVQAKGRNNSSPKYEEQEFLKEYSKFLAGKS